MENRSAVLVDLLGLARFRSAGLLPRWMSTRAAGSRHHGGMTAVEAWFRGGPVDGRLMHVEVVAAAARRW